MDHQVTCFFPTLWMNGSLVQPFAEMLNHTTMSPVGIYLLQQVGVAPWPCMDHHHKTSHIVQLTRVHDKKNIIPKMPPKQYEQIFVKVEKKFCRVSLLSIFSYFFTKELRVMPVGRSRALQQEEPHVRGGVKHRPTLPRALIRRDARVEKLGPKIMLVKFIHGN